MLVDGPDFGGDTLQGFGGVDALLNNEGADELYGGDLSDLLVSASVCDGDLLDGGTDGTETIAGKNNASWTQLDDPDPDQPSQPSGVSAQIAEGSARRLTGGVAACNTGETPDTLWTINDLEGSRQPDHLSGDGARNYLLGNGGQDSLDGREGDDLLQTNDGQADYAADCGEPIPPDDPNSDSDRAWIDSTLDEFGAFIDPDPLNCEVVERLDPGQFGTGP